MREDEQGTAVYGYTVEHGAATATEIATKVGLDLAIVREVLAQSLVGGLVVVTEQAPGGELLYESKPSRDLARHDPEELGPARRC